jgi:aminoglycoside phosphotransferase (APT) family kinase protein
MADTIAHDDIVRTHAEGAANARPPLLVLEPLLAFLDDLGIGEGEPAIQAIGNGRSNATFLLERGSARCVLRPPIPPSANDMLREARVQRALAGHVRVPAILAVSEDPAILGAPFYVMEALDGVVVDDVLPPSLDAVAERRRAGERLVDALVELHAVDWRALGLEDFGRPDGYLERQLRRFAGLWEHHRTRDLPAVERVAAWLLEHLPAASPATIVHGDYRLGNVMLGPEPPADVLAILDWELSTIGDPLADVGYLSVTYADRDDDGDQPFLLSLATRQEGWPSRAELLGCYEERSGRPLGDIRWYETLALWKAVIFMEGNYRRAAEGRSDDPYLKSFGATVPAMAGRAEALIRAAR